MKLTRTRFTLVCKRGSEVCGGGLEIWEKRTPVTLRAVWSYQSYCPPKRSQPVEDFEETVDQMKQIYPVPAVPIYEQSVRCPNLRDQVWGYITLKLVSPSVANRSMWESGTAPENQRKDTLSRDPSPFAANPRKRGSQSPFTGTSPGGGLTGARISF